MTREEPTKVSRQGRRDAGRWITLSLSATVETWILAGLLQAALIVGLILALVW